MIKVHHLNDSRSQRVLWLLEELGLPYEIVPYQRDAATRLAPDSLKAVHPLGKSPVIGDGDLTVAESGAIVDYLITHYGKRRFGPPPDVEGEVQYSHWMHFAEGSAMLPVMLMLYCSRLGEAAGPLWPRIQSEIDNHLSYLEGELADQEYFMGAEVTGPDFMLVFVLEAARAFGQLAKYPKLAAYVDRIHARPAYRAGIEKGGPYSLGG
ncbi:glutathione S-transferase family protein [Zavarzinia compransoris]|uniref:glutathione transferase n=1 Tax=Zavarzinia compransoris TaxID=1264899 RepID=A0A317DYB9_9PROT|nr:glutathione S-transferase family protein [Zavarzinia compransoris]PWR18930.1 glutathione S-transferase [Zavarzinia compransoris]TDP48928.1 glutathione S-transferase [Zavarzinia compransoris]